MSKIKRALISVSDKTGLEKIAEVLIALQVEILSTGGTAKFLKEKGIFTTEASDFSGFPEILDGRVKTLHPKIHGGLLALRSNANHRQQIKEHHFEYIDMVIVNLYPFEKTILKPNVTKEEIIENIDIGGPAMLRSGAKNYKDVAVVCDPADYDIIIEELKKNNGELTLTTKEKLCGKVFNHTSQYDRAISAYFAAQGQEKTQEMPQTIPLQLQKIQDLRYGENPHQKAGFYTIAGRGKNTDLTSLKQLHGKELSFNNILDLEAAWNIVKDFTASKIVTIVKHNNPCGVATAAAPLEAYQKALSCDPVSAFGGIVATNFTVDKEMATEMNKLFLELVIAPAYEDDGLAVLKTKKNLRIIVLPLAKQQETGEFDFKKISGGFLVQEKDTKIFENELKVVTSRKPTAEELEALQFGWTVCKHVKSNAVIFATKDQTIGLGGGQTSRVDSSEIAVLKAQKHGLTTKGTVVASDAFFPFRDGVDAAAKAGATAIIQPGGSVRDEEVIRACNEHNLAMVFTGIRHFRH